MADERNTENFALGLIVAAILFLLFRKQLMKLEGGKTSAEENIPLSSCGCGAGGGTQEPAQNPGVSIGGESYSTGIPFRQSSVVPAPKKTQWVMIQ